MRLTVVFLFLFIGGAIAENTLAQNTKVSFCVQNETIADVLEAVEKQTDFIFIYDNWKIQCKLPPKTKRFCPLVLK